jgi:hypothetical protein
MKLPHEVDEKLLLFHSKKNPLKVDEIQPGGRL